MAIDWSSYSVSPDEAVAGRKEALDKYTNVAQPALQKQQLAERGGLLSDVSTAVGEQAFKGAPASTTDRVLGQAAQKAAEMLPAQGAKQDTMNLQGAAMQEDITGTRQAQKVKNYVRSTEEAKDQAAKYLTNRAFEYGVSAKEMLLHQNGYVADRALAQMYKDLGANRENAADIRAYQSEVALQAKQLRNQLEQDRAQLMYELKVDLANNDMAAAKERYTELMRRNKEAMEAEAKASGLAKILSAVVTVGSTAMTGNPLVGVAAGAGAGYLVNRARS